MVSKEHTSSVTGPVASAQEVLDFWFSHEADWWKKSPAFDALIRERFLPTYEAARAERLHDWRASARTALALVLVLDQFPRNMFRDDPRSFATDAQAMMVARDVIAGGADALLTENERSFLYLPFEHSESESDQRRSMELTSPLSSEIHDFARKHYTVIERFGRFPHRNAALGRPSTAAELEFLNQPGSSF